MSRHDMLVLLIVAQGLLILVMIIVTSVLISLSREVHRITNELAVRRIAGAEHATRPLGKVE